MQTLTLVPVGVGTAYGRPGEAQSAYLVSAGGRAICLDLGAGAMNRLQGRIPPEDLDALVITHLHPDHCADMFSLHIYLAHGPGRGKRLRVIGPPALPDRLRAFLGGDADLEAVFDFDPVEGEEATRALGDGLAVRLAQVPHLPPTYAVRVEWGGRSVVFSADCEPNAALERLAADCDLLLCENSFGELPVPAGVPHLNSADCAAVATASRARRLLLTHCYPEVDRAAAMDIVRAGYDGPADWARQDEAVPA